MQNAGVDYEFINYPGAKHSFTNPGATEVGDKFDMPLEYDAVADGGSGVGRQVQQVEILDLVERGQVYNVESPTMWDIDFKTAVAQAEVEDRPRQGLFYDLRFGVEGGGELLIATTRPELLGACIAVVAHPDDLEYGSASAVARWTAQGKQVVYALVSSGEAGIDSLPPEVTLSFVPYSEDLQGWIDDARAAGHEVILEIPMEPYDYPANDPGPHTLLARADAMENQRRLEWLMSGETGETGKR